MRTLWGAATYKVADIRLLRGKSLDTPINLFASLEQVGPLRGDASPHLPEGSSSKSGESPPPEKNLSGLMGVSGRGKITFLLQ